MKAIYSCEIIRQSCTIGKRNFTEHERKVMETTSLIPILILEDNEFDREITLRAFKKADLRNPVYFAVDGAEALNLLHGTKDNPAICPCIIMTDLNLPRLDGLGFVKELREDDFLKQNIIFVLSTAARDQDIKRGYDLNIAGFFLKDDIQEVAFLMKSYISLNKFMNDRQF